jgi:uncharacterized protein DUF6644
MKSRRVGQARERVVNIQDIAQSLQSTSLSEWLQRSLWAVPTLQAVHILGICVVMSSITIMTLRLIGTVGRSWPLPEVTRHLLSWTWVALLVLLLSGVTMIVADPERELLNDVLRFKMVALMGAVLMTGIVQRLCARGSAFWDRHRLAARVTAALWLMLWVGTAAAGRWIAYFDPD